MMSPEVGKAVRACLPEGGSVCCAVSGGADSMALLWCLHLLAEPYHLTVSAAHFNHRLRGAESDRDAAFVAEFCAAHAIPLTMGSGDAAARAAETGESLEEAARHLRYDFFDTLTADRIATAHTAGDNLETMLANLLRGASLRGLCGIPPQRGRFFRPLLTVTRADVLAFLRAEGIPHVEDSTNGGDDCLRNRLRHQVVPLLLRENPRLYASITEAAARLRADEALLERLTAQLLEDAALEEGFSCAVLRAADSALLHRAMLALLKSSGVPKPTARHVDALCRLVQSDNPSGSVDLPDGRQARRVYGVLVLAEPEPVVFLAPTPVAVPGETVLPGIGTLVCEITGEAGPLTVSLSAIGPLTARSRQTGDAIALTGGTKTLKKLFIEHRIPAVSRSRIPVLTDSRGIVAVAGVAADQSRRQGGPQLRVTLRKEAL